VSVLGGVPYLAPFAYMVAIEAVLGAAPDAVRRLGALGVAVTEDAVRLRDRLRLANAEYERLESMGENWWRVAHAPTGNSARALLYRLGEQKYRDRMLLAWARSAGEASDPQWRELATLSERWNAPAFPLKASDFIARGVEKGPRLGAVMQAAEEAWIAADFPADAAALADIAERVARRQ
jgi:poly(A) polymerase